MKRVPVTSEWVEVYLIGMDTFVIYEPGPPEEATSTLVISGTNAALIDTGCGISNIADVIDEITDLPVFVVNTHSHNDHIVDNHRFKEIWMLDHPWSIVARKGLPNSEMTHLIAKGFVWKPLPKRFKKEKYIVQPFKAAHFFKDGEEIDLSGRMLEVIHTPSARGWHLHIPKRRRNISTFIKGYRKMLTHYDEFNRLMPSHNERARRL